MKDRRVLGMLPAGGPLAGFLQRPQAGFRKHVNAGEKCSQVSHSRSFIIYQPSSNPRFCLAALVRAGNSPGRLSVCPNLLLSGAGGWLLIRNAEKNEKNFPLRARPATWPHGMASLCEPTRRMVASSKRAFPQSIFACKAVDRRVHRLLNYGCASLTRRRSSAG